MKMLLRLVAVSVSVAMVMGEFCSTNDQCLMERCPHGYVATCEPTNVCSCDIPVVAPTGECSSSGDCGTLYGSCENNDKHWYCNGHTCCCGEPCPHAGDKFICSSPRECADNFFKCTNNDKHWYCTDSHCHCGSRHGSIHS